MNFIDSSNESIDEVIIKAVSDNVIYNEGSEIKTLDGSIQANIVINSEDKEYVNEQTEQTNKIMDDEREAKRELYYRQARSLYPEKEDWILNMAIDAFMEQEDKGIDILTHSFKSLRETPSDPLGGLMKNEIRESRESVS